MVTRRALGKGGCRRAAVACRAAAAPFFRFWRALLLASLLAACGGGGGGGGGDEAPSPLALAQGSHCSASLAAENPAGWCWQRPLPQGNTLADVSITASGHGWAVGEAGTLLKTSDNGASWVAQRAPTTQDLLKVVAVDSQVAWLAAAQGEVLVTDNGGALWRTLQLDSPETPQALGASSARQAWVLGTSGTRYSYNSNSSDSPDSSARWQRTPAPPEGVFGTPLCTADGNLWVLPHHALVNSGARYGMAFARSPDDGARWLQGSMPPLVEGRSRNATSLQASSGSHALIRTDDAGFDASSGLFVSRADLWRTADGGISWQTARLAPNDTGANGANGANGNANANAGGVSYQMFSATAWLAVLPGHSAQRSTDGGNSWSALPLPSELGGGENLKSVQQVGDARYLLSSIDGQAWYSTNAGTQWTALRTGGGAGQPTLGSVHFFDHRNGLAIGRDGSHLRTSDGGLGWTADASTHTGPTPMPTNAAWGADWRRAQFLPGSDLGWVLADASTLLRSTDRGRSWQAPSQTPSAGMPGLSDFHFIDAQRGWAVLDPGSAAQASVFRSSDGGLSWQAVAGSGSYGGLVAVRFASDGQHGVALTSSGAALVSSDGGSTWAPRSLGINTRLRRLVLLPDDSTLVAVGDAGVVLRSTDRGHTWQRMASPSSSALNNVFFASPLRGWAVGEQGTVLTTTDGGLGWQAQASGTRASLHGLHFVNNSTGWAVGEQGTVLTTTDGGLGWQAQASGTHASLHGLYFVDSSTGWVVGSQGGILVTVSGGH